MKCVDVELWIQEFLDGESTGRPDAVDVHLRACGRCQRLHRAALALQRAISVQPSIIKLPVRTDRIVSAVLAQRRCSQRQRRRWAGVAAIAAGVLLAVGISTFVTSPAPSGSHAVPIVSSPQPPRPTFQASVKKVRVAVADGATRIAASTVDGARSWLPSSQDPMLPQWSVTPSLTTASPSIQQTTERVGSGLEPVTSSARRAVDLFMRDLPALSPSRKKG